MSNVVYKGRGQVAMYRIYRHSITLGGPQNSEEDNTFLWEQQLYSQKWFLAKG